MRRNRKNVFATMALLLLGVACTNEKYEDFVGSKNTADKVSFFVEPLTRAGETTFDTGDAIGVFASTTSDGTLNSTGNYADNAKYAYASGSFIHTGSGISTPNLPGSTVTYYAVYPFAEQRTPQFSFTVNTDQTTYDAYTKSDLMLAKATASASSQKVPLRFDHVMSRLLIDASALGLYQGTYSIEVICQKATMDVNLQQQTIESKSDVKRIKPCGDGDHHFKVILPPQTLNKANVTATLHINGKSASKSVIMYSSVDLRPGTSVELKLREKNGEYYFY